MIRFMFFSMVIIALSFMTAPIFFGISKQHEKLTERDYAEKKSDDLSFEEIYAMAAEDNYSTDPAALNSITPAAGNEEEQPDTFSNGFSNIEDSALEDSPTQNLAN